MPPCSAFYTMAGVKTRVLIPQRPKLCCWSHLFSPYKDSFDAESLAQNQSRYFYESNHREGMPYDAVLVLILPGTCVYSLSPMNHFLHCHSPPESFSQHFLSSCGEPGPHSGDSSLPGSTPTSWIPRVHLLLCSEAPTWNIISHDRMSFHMRTKIALASVFWVPFSSHCHHLIWAPVERACHGSRLTGFWLLYLWALNPFSSPQLRLNYMSGRSKALIAIFSVSTLISFSFC